jgi:hypothetical protein
MFLYFILKKNGGENAGNFVSLLDMSDIACVFA